MTALRESRGGKLAAPALKSRGAQPAWLRHQGWCRMNAGDDQMSWALCNPPSLRIAARSIFSTLGCAFRIARCCIHVHNCADSCHDSSLCCAACASSRAPQAALQRPTVRPCSVQRAPCLQVGGPALASCSRHLAACRRYFGRSPLQLTLTRCSPDFTLQTSFWRSLASPACPAPHARRGSRGSGGASPQPCGPAARL